MDTDIYTQRVDAQGNIMWPDNGIPVCTAAGDQHSTQIVNDTQNGAIIAWEDQRSSSSKIYIQRINSEGVAQWSSEGIKVSNTLGNETAPQLIGDDDGKAIVTWQDYRGGTIVIFIF